MNIYIWFNNTILWWFPIKTSNAVRTTTVDYLAGRKHSIIHEREN